MASDLSAIELNASQTKPQQQKSATSLKFVGSDTMANLIFFWMEEFQREHPTISSEVRAEGSSTAPPALLTGESHIAPMSRLMTKAEITTFEEQWGYKPTRIRVALDALAIFVHSENPINTLTLEQIDSIFSSTQNCSNTPSIVGWDKIPNGLKETPIRLYGRTKNSGSSDFFKEVGLCNGSYKRSIIELPGSSSVIQAISSDIAAIGFSGIGYKTSGVKNVYPTAQNGQVLKPSTDNITNGQYPFSRYLYLYLNKKPKQPLPRIEREFIELVLSDKGQNIVELDGFRSLTGNEVTTQLNLIHQ